MGGPRLIPVLDVMGGRVVRAVGGRREAYRPVVSRVTSSTDPVRVANDLLAATGAAELYVADLDAIRGDGRPTVGQLLETVRVPILLDCGVRDRLPALPSHVRPVVGTETAGRCPLTADCVLSLDLFDGKLLGEGTDLFEVAADAVAEGVRTLIVLDLAAVGTAGGPRTLAVCRELRWRFPTVELLSGGGVRNRADLDRFAAAGVAGVLVASALHDGLLGD